uniref:Neuroendocrine protein 7B2 n=1 Tax=Heterorhabditis bacteriophora TaxID=37862 RepID=A0A1I7XV92_HETBA
MLALLSLLVVPIMGFNLETPSDLPMLPSGDFIDLISRDAENVPEPIAFGSKYITGGAGEGEQKLREEGGFQQRQEVKSDNVLPAYCEPPNPCPNGYTMADGCIEKFENSAEFSRNYQAHQRCICDQEHMFNCAEKEASDVGASLQQLLDANGLHRNMIAKKFHEKRSSDELTPRRKRSVSIMDDSHNYIVNPYLQGEPLKTMSKKNGKKVW